MNPPISLLIISCILLCAGAEAAQVVVTHDNLTVVAINQTFRIGPGSGGGDGAPHTTVALTTTSVINDAGTHLREYGHVDGMTINLASGATHTWQIGTIPNPFPNPPTPVYESFTMSSNLEITIPSFDFDTGDLPLIWNGTEYRVATATDQTFAASARFTYSVTTGGQTYTGDETYAISYSFIPRERTVLTGDFPNSLSMAKPILLLSDVPITGITLASGVAANGVEYEFKMIPEPSAAVFGGLSLLCVLRRRRE